MTELIQIDSNQEMEDSTQVKSNQFESIDTVPLWSLAIPPGDNRFLAFNDNWKKIAIAYVHVMFKPGSAAQAAA